MKSKKSTKSKNDKKGKGGRLITGLKEILKLITTEGTATNDSLARMTFYMSFAIVTAGIFYLSFGSVDLFAQSRLPGVDASDKLEAAGTLLRLLDTALFKWGARLFAGLCIMSGAWMLKEQRYGISIVCIIGAIIFGTAPTWVRNIFSIGSEDSVFGLLFLYPAFLWNRREKSHYLEEGSIECTTTDQSEKSMEEKSARPLTAQFLSLTTGNFQTPLPLFS